MKFYDEEEKEKSTLTEEQEKDIVEEFKELVKAFNLNIKDKIETIEKLTNELVDCSNKHGIPFDLHGETYVPTSFQQKFSKYDSESLQDEIDLAANVKWLGTYHIGDQYYTGWMNSSSYCS